MRKRATFASFSQVLLTTGGLTGEDAEEALAVQVTFSRTPLDVRSELQETTGKVGIIGREKEILPGGVVELTW
eukprot:scaffold8478_cov286-Pinguiococcus_pyrenoidosus.AAC.2